MTTDYTVNCIQGYVEVMSFDGYTGVLISRRCAKRLGMRYLLRGADKDGNCANFVETEQILYNKQNTNAFLQVRGSIPLFWGHKLSLRWNPALTYKKSDIIAKAHSIVAELYTNVHYLNLINCKNHENELKQHYKQEMTKHNISHTNYDYKDKKFASKKEVREEFVADMSGLLDKYGFDSNNTKQTGVVRTNCIDCLDRTNVVQSFIAQYMLQKQLQNLNAKNTKQCVDAYKKAFVRNGNYLSVQYAGTGSLQSELITDGKVSAKGKIRDGINSVRRYRKNRFAHGRLQDGYKLATGNVSKVLLKKAEKHSASNVFYIFFLFALLAIHFYAQEKCTSNKTYFALLASAIFCFLVFFVAFQDMFFDQAKYTSE